ncbi:hypothetical protein CcaverHIS002_0312390 [Cutaneotrichosporon cavernicola]|uniref:DUF567-domain-containing protein n=1 Tax=Cutaneotrichosporon cavernicola TaxID=279322 RepID=A0AA48QVB4_9TREE|nr:uncharacterized protein CcaverHIS019_0312260 [Cutaneotrichosporon cavernicola]BEI83371.1 hypothetical protein CcaverHIS002_0312390 [Cutaneotrichosporon cavernicola]BEI91156.1 hypothetical protein CcaverHIS019_0312260 [Cutaneotrichosporon cavernicola]BEI98933.1 hypothetical protein CcaverHIS631_0312320 [Cutaneotrichosporon cavernicola]BEJ06707.1 hypothetical protein CcaverHIS641_0312290 [Cutaneotrichosporon cavernicola]
MESHADLVPVRPPLALFGRNVRSVITQVTVLEDMFPSGDNYTVTDSDGSTIIRAKAEEWSRLNKKVVYDDMLRPLGEISNKALSLRQIVEFTSNSGELLLEASFHAGTNGLPSFRAKMGDKLEMAVVGDWKQHAADIVTSDGILLARGSHENEWKEGDPAIPQRQYKLDVAPGVDLALVAIVSLCLDMVHMRVEKK